MDCLAELPERIEEAYQNIGIYIGKVDHEQSCRLQIASMKLSGAILNVVKVMIVYFEKPGWSI
jgi:hypothetical protein